jgi:hypothetical protein
MPVIIITHKKEKRCILILHTTGEKCYAKEAEKKLKYKEFFIQVQRIDMI